MSPRFLVAALIAASSSSQSEPGVERAQGKWPTYAIAADTTYFVAPLDREGYVDYITAVNERLRQGVTPENNANVLYWKAMGPHPEDATMPPEFFKWLGIPEPPKEGGYFISLHRFITDRYKGEPRDTDKSNDLLIGLARRPWQAKQHPQVADWLKVNDKALSLVIAGTKRPRYFLPMVPPKSKDGKQGMLISSLVPSVLTCRQLAQALAVRAMLELDEGRIDEAWQDLIACHRLGRHVGSGATLIESLIGFAIEDLAALSDLILLENARFNTKQLQACRKEYDQLPPLSAVVEKIDGLERWWYLDAITGMEHWGVESLSGSVPARSNSARPTRLDCNWDAVLREGNNWFDRIVAAMRLKDRAEREAELTALDAELQKLKKINEESQTLGYIFALLDREARTQRFSNIMIVLMMPALCKAQQAEDRAEQRRHNLRLAFALAAYKSDHGSYPGKLSALAPEYLPQIPLDLFSGKELIYSPTETGYLLYSVGVNGRDDGGQGYEDVPPCDDLPIRIPTRSLKKQAK